MSNKIIRRGEVYQVNLGSQEGSIQAGVRPVVIISNDLNNKYSPTVTVLPITSKSKNNLPTHVDAYNREGLEKPSTILCEQILTVNKLQLIRQLGNCNYNKLQEIENALLVQVGINNNRNRIMAV